MYQWRSKGPTQKKIASMVDAAPASRSTTAVESRPEHQPKARFDQQAALEELERFGREIQRYRAQRQALGDEFETFVRSLKAPTEPLANAQPAVTQPKELPTFPVPVPTPPSADTSPAEPAEQRQADAAATRSGEVLPPRVDAVAQPVVVPEPVAAPAPRERPRRPGAAVAAVAVLVGVVLTAFLLNRGPEPADPAAGSESAAATSAPAATATPAAPADAPATSAAPPPAQPPAESEIVTERQVWMRVIVDGNRVLEREVPPGTRIPLKAEKTIVIRTGDAGAVRLSLRGAPGELLGREGEVVTRTITVPPRAPAGRD
jgi:hypothetical protein